MNKIIFILLYTLLSTSVFSQQFSISNGKCDDFYQFISNPVIVTVANTDCNNIYITASKGSITGNGCYYEFTSKEIGRVKINIYKLSKKDTTSIGSVHFNIIEFPGPTLSILGITKGDISKELLSSVRTLDLSLITEKYGSLDPPYRITHYSISIMRADSCLYTDTVTGQAIREETKKQFKALVPNDIVIFYNVKYNLVDKKDIYFEKPLLLRIK
ncbi:MAG: GldM family protein [Bacteroidales bacterium]|jgi:predicted secreted protein|nr:GldM family protein [Bacteroidales bacterium]